MKIFAITTIAFLFNLLLLQDKKQILLNADVDLTTELGKDHVYNRTRLTEDEMKLADSLVAQYMLHNHDQYKWTSRVDTYYEYYRQYAGYVQFSPERKIIVNAFKEKGNVSDEFLQAHLFTAKGGGSSFFSIKVNLKTKACFDLRVNAPR